jgi:hypothetical protein
MTSPKAWRLYTKAAALGAEGSKTLESLKQKECNPMTNQEESKNPAESTNKFAVAGPQSKYQAPDAELAGFWAGVWHGAIMPITFIVSLFNDGVRIYETHNNGKWYDFGFLVGASMAFGGGKKGVNIDINGQKKFEDAEDIEKPSE